MMANLGSVPPEWLQKWMRAMDEQTRMDMMRRLQAGVIPGTNLPDPNATVSPPMKGIPAAAVKPVAQHPLPEHMHDHSQRPTYFAKVLMRLGWYDDLSLGTYMHMRGKLQIVAVTEPLDDGLGPAVFVIGNGKPMALRDSQPELFPSDGFVTKLKMLENPT